MPLSPKKQGSFPLLIERESQTRTFIGEVVDGDTGGGTCLVRLSGGKVQTCDVLGGRQTQLHPGDPVSCVHMPGHVRLVVQSSPTIINQTTTITNISSGGGGSESEVKPPGLSAPVNLVATAFGSGSETFPVTAILDSFNRADELMLPSPWAGSETIGVSNNMAVGLIAGVSGSDRWRVDYGSDLEAYVQIGAAGTAPNGEIILMTQYAPEISVYQGQNLRWIGGGAYADKLYLNPSDATATYLTEIQLPATLGVGDWFGYSMVGSTIQVYVRYGTDPWQTVGDPFACANYGTGHIFLGVYFGAKADTFGGGSVVTSGVRLDWSSDGIGITNYHVEKSLDDLTYTQIGIVPVTQTSYFDEDVTPSATYYYRVRAISATSVSAYSNVATAVFP